MSCSGILGYSYSVYTGKTWTVLGTIAGTIQGQLLWYCILWPGGNRILSICNYFHHLLFGLTLSRISDAYLITSPNSEAGTFVQPSPGVTWISTSSLLLDLDSSSLKCGLITFTASWFGLSWITVLYQEASMRTHLHALPFYGFSTEHQAFWRGGAACGAFRRYFDYIGHLCKGYMVISKEERWSGNQETNRATLRGGGRGLIFAGSRH